MDNREELEYAKKKAAIQEAHQLNRKATVSQFQDFVDSINEYESDKLANENKYERTYINSQGMETDVIQKDINLGWESPKYCPPSNWTYEKDINLGWESPKYCPPSNWTYEKLGEHSVRDESVFVRTIEKDGKVVKEKQPVKLMYENTSSDVMIPHLYPNGFGETHFMHAPDYCRNAGLKPEEKPEITMTLEEKVNKIEENHFGGDLKTIAALAACALRQQRTAFTEVEEEIAKMKDAIETQIYALGLNLKVLNKIEDKVNNLKSLVVI